MFFRQVHKTGINKSNNWVKSFVFKPRDLINLSVYDGSRTSAKEAFNHYIKFRNSIGVIGITEEDCNLLNLKIIEDPLPNFEEHCIIKFTYYKTRREVEKVAKELRELSHKYGWLYKKSN